MEDNTLFDFLYEEFTKECSVKIKETKDVFGENKSEYQKWYKDKMFKLCQDFSNKK